MLCQTASPGPLDVFFENVCFLYDCYITGSFFNVMKNFDVLDFHLSFVIRFCVFLMC